MKNFDFIKNEHEVLKHWEKINIFNKMVERNKDSKERYVHQDGPITANGSMCMHHVWGRTLKDAFIKYATLQGRSCQFQNGFDAQGMWVEVEVEKLLGLNDKKAILDYGLENFTEKCIERVNYFADMQTRQSIRLGQIMDWDNSYFTNSDENITGIWHFLKVVHEKGWLKKSYKCMPWCPRCGTSLSEHEMNGSYKDVEHSAVFVKLPVGNEKLLIWTTTPWTLRYNVAVAVNPNDTYIKVRVKSDNALIIVGKEALKKLRADVVEVVSEVKGSELVGLEYTRPHGEGTGKIIPWDAVSAREGSGLVHIAPGCGAEDFELGKMHGLEPLVPPESVTESDDQVFKMLEKVGTMYYSHPYTHSYPFCWRCKTDVMFRLVDGWDITTVDVKPSIFKAIEKIQWQPAYTERMMTDWITNMGDWNISRRRFYGLPLPFYPCDCGHLTVVGSLKELKNKAVEWKNLPHLHRPYIDEILIKCDKCKKPTKRVPDVGDCWLDAGIVPFSTKKYFTDKTWWEKNFPIDIVIEMKEQIRLWFYSMLFMSVVMLDRAPWKKCFGFNTMLDEEGKKFSKTGKKNIPFDVASETYGADAMRYVFVAANPALDIRFGESMIDDAKRKMMAFLNTVSFYKTYADIDKPDVLKGRDFGVLNITDEWLLEATNNYTIECTMSYENHNLQYVIAATEKFVEDLSNFYIRTNRRRFWKGENNTDKLNAYYCLYHAIRAITIVMAPLTPFISEYVWGTMFAEVEKRESVMLSNWPFARASERGLKIIEDVEFIKRITTIGHKLRAVNVLKVKQPLQTIYVKGKVQAKNANVFDEYLREELNVKKVEWVTDDDKFNVPYLVVNFREAGKILGPKVQELKAKLEKSDMTKMVADYDKCKLDKRLYERKLKSRPEFVSETDGDLTVVLDTTLTAELIEEGKLREVVRAIQVARQEAGFEITARVNIELITEEFDIINKSLDKIKEEVLAKEIVVKKGKELNVKFK